MEQLLTKAPSDLNDEALAAWTSTVVRNEALQIHRRRRHEVEAEFEEIAEGWVSDAPAPEEMLLDTEQFAQGREALARLNPDQTRCLLLRADGLGYPEICEITGFSYAKVNRLLSEGRKAFHLHVGMIDSGRECERLAPALSMLADGEDPANRDELDRHLSSCLHCKSTLRDYRGTARDLGALMPVGAFALADAEKHGLLARVGQALRAPVDWLQARLSGSAAEMHQGAEVALAKKVAIVVGVGASVVAGGVVAERAVERGSEQSPPSAITTPGTISPAQLDKVEVRESAESRARARRADAAERRKREAAESVEAAAADASAPAASAPGSGTAVDNGVAADPADQPPAGAQGTDGQAEGLAP